MGISAIHINGDVYIKICDRKSDACPMELDPGPEDSAENGTKRETKLRACALPYTKRIQLQLTAVGHNGPLFFYANCGVGHFDPPHNSRNGFTAAQRQNMEEKYEYHYEQQARNHRY